jgi:hypothetical protein
MPGRQEGVMGTAGTSHLVWPAPGCGCENHQGKKIVRKIMPGRTLVEESVRPEPLDRDPRCAALPAGVRVLYQLSLIRLRAR